MEINLLAFNVGNSRLAVGVFLAGELNYSTRITIDCCNDQGDFLGGAIAPGAAMMLAAMHEKTAKLPQVEFKVPEHAFGKSTEQAMFHGVYHGIRGMVKEIVENYATELGEWPE